MSTTAQLPVIRPARPARQEPQRRFEVVEDRARHRARPKVLHAVIAVIGVLGIIGAQLLISIWVSSGAYRISELQQEQRALVREGENLSEQLLVRGSNQYLATAAAALGMSPAKRAYYLDAQSGTSSRAPGIRLSLKCATTCSRVANSLITGLPLPQPVATTADTVVAGAESGVETSAIGDAAQSPSSSGWIIPETTDAAVSQESPTTSNGIPAVLTH